MNRSSLVSLVIAVLSLSLSAQAATLKVEAAWVRATAPGQPVGGAYMKLTSDANGELVGISSPVAGVTQIHMMKIQNGMMLMRELKTLPLPRGKTVELVPGGYHVMLMDLKQPLKEGETVPLTLEVKFGKKIEKIDVKAEVRDMMTME
jgi:copper(I)-binding protein